MWRDPDNGRTINNYNKFHKSIYNLNVGDNFKIKRAK